jgi:hypothetical protein
MQIDSAGRIRLPRARRVSHQRCQMNHCFLPQEGCAQDRLIAYVTPNEFKSRVTPDAEQGLAAMSQIVQNANLMTCSEQ